MSNQLGAVNVGGILQNASGNNLTLIQQSNGVLRVAKLGKKRKPKRVEYYYTAGHSDI